MRVRLATRAQADFDEIVDYLKAVASPDVAARYGRDIQVAINRLVDFPKMGSRRSRAVIVYPYLIFYEEESESGEVVVLRILHGRRRITSELLQPRGS